MASRDDKDQHVKPKRSRRARRQPARTESYKSSKRPTIESPESRQARELYLLEKARRATRERPADHPLEQARRAYEALLAAEAEAQRGGRPRKLIVRKPVAGSGSNSEDSVDGSDDSLDS